MNHWNRHISGMPLVAHTCKTQGRALKVRTQMKDVLIFANVNTITMTFACFWSHWDVLTRGRWKRVLIRPIIK